MQFNEEEFNVLLARRRLSREAFARQSGVATNTIRQMAAGRAFQSDTIERIARFLNVSPLDLIIVDDAVSVK